MPEKLATKIYTAALIFCALLMPLLAFAGEIPRSYTVTIHSSCGESVIYEAVAHDVVFDNRVLSIIGKDRRRYLINLDGKIVEFSKELDAILKSQSDKK